MLSTGGGGVMGDRRFTGLRAWPLRCPCTCSGMSLSVPPHAWRHHSLTPTHTTQQRFSLNNGQCVACKSGYAWSVRTEPWLPSLARTFASGAFRASTQPLIHCQIPASASCQPIARWPAIALSCLKSRPSGALCANPSSP